MARLPPRPATPARFALGMAQMFGAAAGLTLLITTGVSPATLGVVAVTTGLSIASRLLYRREGPRWRHHRASRQNRR